MTRMDTAIELHGEDVSFYTFTPGADTGYGEATRTYTVTPTTVRALIQPLAQASANQLTDLGTGKPGEAGYLVSFESDQAGVVEHIRIDSAVYGLLELTAPIRTIKPRGITSHIEAHAQKVPE